MVLIDFIQASSKKILQTIYFNLTKDGNNPITGFLVNITMKTNPYLSICRTVKANKIELFRPTIALIFGVLLSVIGYTEAFASNYYDIPDAGRPRAAFSLCCCKKEIENNQNVFYSCKYVEEYNCPENTKPYTVSFGNCPSNLMFSKPQQN